MSGLPLLRPEHVDGRLIVSDGEAIAAARRLAREEGIFAGFSSGANLAAALRIVENRTVAILINDSGLKYLSTDLWG
jgi:cysteine synthase A